MKVNTVGKTFSEVEYAYIAGLVDGDGAIMASIEPHAEKRFGFRVRVLFKITQHKKQDLAWMCERSGMGHIRKDHNAYKWIIRDQVHIRALLSALMSHLRIKKQQAVYRNLKRR